MAACNGFSQLMILPRVSPYKAMGSQLFANPILVRLQTESVAIRMHCMIAKGDRLRAPTREHAFFVLNSLGSSVPHFETGRPGDFFMHMLQKYAKFRYFYDTVLCHRNKTRCEHH